MEEERKFLTPDFSYLNDIPLSWRHYISPIDQKNWFDYPTEIKRAIYHLALGMMMRDVSYLDKDFGNG